jgi:tellurite resistance protein TerC
MAATLGHLRYLHYGLAAVLVFAGLKMIIPESVLHIPPLGSVAIIIGCIGLAVWASIRWKAPVEPTPGNVAVKELVDEEGLDDMKEPAETAEHRRLH